MLCDKGSIQAEYSVHIYEVYLMRQRRGQDKGIWSLRECVYHISGFCWKRIGKTVVTEENFKGASHVM